MTNSKEIPKPLTLYVEMGFGLPKKQDSYCFYGFQMTWMFNIKGENYPFRA